MTKDKYDVIIRKHYGPSKVAAGNSQPYRTLLEHSSAALSPRLRAGLNEWLTAPIDVAWPDVHPTIKK